MQIKDYLLNYSSKLNKALSNVDGNALEKLYTIIQQGTITGSQFFVCGNGGSAAVAEHSTCDHAKGVYNNTKSNPHYLTPKFVSLTSNVSLITAIANDLGYDKIFSEQIDMFGTSKDVLIAISSSGNSPNIIEAIYSARKKGMKVVCFTGFDGGAAKANCDVSIHVNENNYGISEDCHQILMHVLFQCISINHTVDLNTLRI